MKGNPLFGVIFVGCDVRYYFETDEEPEEETGKLKKMDSATDAGSSEGPAPLERARITETESTVSGSPHAGGEKTGKREEN